MIVLWTTYSDLSMLRCTNGGDMKLLRLRVEETESKINSSLIQTISSFRLVRDFLFD